MHQKVGRIDRFYLVATLVWFVIALVTVFPYLVGGRFVLAIPISVAIFIEASALFTQAIPTWKLRKLSWILIGAAIIVRTTVTVVTMHGTKDIVTSLIVVAAFCYLFWATMTNLAEIEWYPVMLLLSVLPSRKAARLMAKATIERKNGKTRTAMELAAAAMQVSNPPYRLFPMSTFDRLFADEPRTALEILESVQKTNQNSALLHRFFGMLYYETGNHRKAIDELTIPEDRELDFDALYCRAESHADLQQYADAIKDYSILLSQSPRFSPALYGRGLCFDALGKIDDARSDWLLASELEPPDPRSMIALAHNLSADGDEVSAAKYYKTALALDSSMAAYVPTLYGGQLIDNE